MNSSRKIPIAVAYGDGIGPEIMTATLEILKAAGAPLAPEVIEIGEKVYKQGGSSGIAPASWEILRKTKVFLKAPITTPQGGGFKSLNVTTRTMLGLYANVRPNQAYAPYVSTDHPEMNVVIIRENEEDLYTGIEYRQTNQVVEGLKIMSREGCEKIVHYAFEYALAYNRKKVTCFTKDNIMKMTDGLFHKVFDEIGAEYPQIEKEHWIIDIGSALLADEPERFEVIVTLNLYGDIISDIAAQIAGSVGMGGSANIGDVCAMFEAIHGSAPDIAGKGIANPSGLLNGAIMMLVHIGQGKVAAKIQNAWLKTLEDGIHTSDIFKEGLSTKKVGTAEFARAVINRLGLNPKHFKTVTYNELPKKISGKKEKDKKQKKEWVGVDLYFDYEGKPEALGKFLENVGNGKLVLKAITNRGVVAFPDPLPEANFTDHWRARFLDKNNSMKYQDLLDILVAVGNKDYEIIKTENLYTFDGKPGYSSIAE